MSSIPLEPGQELFGLSLGSRRGLIERFRRIQLAMHAFALVRRTLQVYGFSGSLKLPEQI